MAAKTAEMDGRDVVIDPKRGNAPAGMAANPIGVGEQEREGGGEGGRY